MNSVLGHVFYVLQRFNLLVLVYLDCLVFWLVVAQVHLESHACVRLVLRGLIRTYEIVSFLTHFLAQIFDFLLLALNLSSAFWRQLCSFAGRKCDEATSCFAVGTNLNSILVATDDLVVR